MLAKSFCFCWMKEETVYVLSYYILYLLNLAGYVVCRVNRNKFVSPSLNFFTNSFFNQYKERV